MKKVLLIDYYGTCTADGREVGHSGKVLNEYKDLIKDYYEVSAALSPCLVNGLNDRKTDAFRRIYTLKYNICMENLKSVTKRFKDKLKLFYNLHQAFKLKDYDIMWFYRTDFFLALYLSLFIPKKRRRVNFSKIVVQLYHNSFGENIFGRLLNHIYYAGFKKADGIISTQKGLKNLGIPYINIPDYYYDAQKYEKYRNMHKEEKAVCVGTMSPYKQVGPLADAFSKNGIPLEIRGCFYDKEQYNQLSKYAGENIVIEDAVLTEDEYYCAIAGAKYAVLPYDMGQYQSRTSGVLQECLFLNTVAVAPWQLLRENGIEGIGYNNIEELADASFFDRDVQWDRVYEQLSDEYSLEKVRRSLAGLLRELSESPA